MELTRRWLALAVACGVATACGDTTVMPDPTPTALRVDLQTPHVDDGAIVIMLAGPDVSNLQSVAPGQLLYVRESAPGERQVIVIGDLKAGALFTFSIAPEHHRSEYTAVIRQVALRTDLLRDDLSGYRLAVTIP